MSYLHLPRIIFSGDFISDVSTVNNDPAHYNNDTFRPTFQDFGQGGTNGWWNPEGGATFNFQDCTIQKVCYSDGTVADSGSMLDLIGEFIMGAEGRSAGKMVDLDPQQQMVSQLWAVTLRIVNAEDEEILSGELHPTAFRDLQMRQTAGGKLNGQPRGASWTSILQNVKWGAKAKNYKILAELKAATQENCLSINLNGFGYYYNHAPDGRFSLGRLLGSIGPYFTGEPKTFAAERRLFGTKISGTNENGPTFFSLTNFSFDEKTNLLSIDFGNSFPIGDAMGTVTIANDYVLAISNFGLNNAPDSTPLVLNYQEGEFTPIGDLPYFQGDWLNKTGGIIDLKIPDPLGKLLANNQLILLQMIDGQANLIARESWNGLNVRAEQMVQRINADAIHPVDFHASKWGKPLQFGTIQIAMAKKTDPTSGPICPIPGNNFPQNGLTFDTTAPIITNGKTQMNITGGRINCPRVYIDGQIYFLSYALENSQTDYADSSNDAISVYLFDYFEVPKKPKWTDIQATMQQFSNLYPIMSKYLVDLGNREAVLARKEILLFAFTQDINSPMYMPVTRDLSESKRLTIVEYLKSNGKYDNEKIVEEKDVAARAAKKTGKAASGKTDNVEITAAPSEFQQKLVVAMRAKMGALPASEDIEDLTKL